MRNNGRTILIWALFWAIWTALTSLYNVANRVYVTETGDLPGLWWFFALAYFVVDTLLAVAAFYFCRVFASHDAAPKEPFRRQVLAIVSFWFMFHFSSLCLQYPIYTRLESVGLGKLEMVAIIGFVLVGAAYRFRLSGAHGESNNNGSQESQWQTAVTWVVILIVLLIVLYFFGPYLKTRPLPH